MNLHRAREKDKLLISMAAMVARRRLERGVKLNHPEAVALISDFVVEGARDGRTVADLMEAGASVVTPRPGHGRHRRDDPRRAGGGDIPRRRQARHRAQTDQVRSRRWSRHVAIPRSGTCNTHSIAQCLGPRLRGDDDGARARRRPVARRMPTRAWSMRSRSHRASSIPGPGSTTCWRWWRSACGPASTAGARCGCGRWPSSA